MRGVRRTQDISVGRRGVRRTQDISVGRRGVGRTLDISEWSLENVGITGNMERSRENL